MYPIMMKLLHYKLVQRRTNLCRDARLQLDASRTFPCARFWRRSLQRQQVACTYGDDEKTEANIGSHIDGASCTMEGTPFR